VDLGFDLTTCAWVVGVVLAFTFTRYVVISGLWYLVAYRWLRDALHPHKNDARYPPAEVIWAELKLGTANLINFCGFGILILWLYVHGYTRLYFEVGQFGWAYLVLSVALVFVIQDAYFYWAHRLLHTKFFMKHAHGAHHRFRNPTPFAAFAVHPLEGFLEVGFRPIVLCLLPLHPGAIAFLLVSSFLINAFGHGGVEVLVRGWSRHPILGQINCPTHHYVHHKYVTANFSLYFTWWDRLMGTEHPAFHDEFEAVALPMPSFADPAPAPAPSPALAGSCSARMGLVG